MTFREGRILHPSTPRPDGWEGNGEAIPPRRLDISRRGIHRVAPGLKPGAYLWRGPRQGPPAAAAELPPPSRAWLGLGELYEQNSR